MTWGSLVNRPRGLSNDTDRRYIPYIEEKNGRTLTIGGGGQYVEDMPTRRPI